MHHVHRVLKNPIGAQPEWRFSEAMDLFRPALRTVNIAQLSAGPFVCLPHG